MGNVKAPDEIQQEFIDGFVAAGDTFEQFDYLLQLSAQLEELPEERKVKEALVEGCQSRGLAWRQARASRLKVTATRSWCAV